MRVDKEGKSKRKVKSRSAIHPSLKAEGFRKKIGTKAEVWHQTAKQTKGGITKNGLTKTKHDRIVFKSKSAAAKKNNNLGKAGISTRKNEFGAIRNGINLTKNKRSLKRLTI